MTVVKSVEVDLSVRGDTESKAKLDAISLKADELKKQFGPAYALKIDSAAATAKLGIFRADFKKTADMATKAIDVQVVSAKATKALEDIRVRADKLRATFPTFTARIDTAEAERKLAVLAADAKVTTDRINREIAGAGSGGILSKIPGFGGGSGGAGAAGGAAAGAGGVIPAGIPLIGGLGSTGGTAAVVAGLAALPFAAQAAAGGIVFALGGAMTAIGVYAASKSTEVKAQFASLKAEAIKDFGGIGTPFNAAVTGILKTAQTTLPRIVKPFGDALKSIAGPFGQFGDALVKAFGSPAVVTSMRAVGTAFGALLKAITPSIAGDMNNIASGITKVANAVAKNPDALRNFISFLSATVGGALTAIAALTRFASYVEAHFIPVFDGARHEIAHVMAGILSNVVDTWNKIWTQTIGRAIQGAHDVEADYNSLKNAILVTVGAIRTGVVAAWNTIWTNTVTRVQNGIANVVRFFTGLPGKVTSALSSLGTVLLNIGKGAMGSLLSGFTSVAGSILSWLGNFAKSVLNAIGSVFGIHFSEPSVSTVFHQVGAQIMQGMINGIESKTNAAVGAAKGAAGAVAGAAGASGGAVAALMKQMAAARGWTGAQWNALYALEMNEAGFSLTARNPSGAYGLAQFIQGPSEYYQYGGNPNTAAGQITGMLNYIAQRYGTPAAAWAFEKSHVPNWYGSGLDAMFSRPTLIGVGEAGPEHVTVTPRGKAGGGMSAGEQAIVAALADMSRRIDNLTGVTASVPRATGQHVGAAIGGAAHDASFRSRYH